MRMNTMNGWKLSAILLGILLILETLLMVWAFFSGSDSIDKENQCSVNICGPGYQNGTYDSYLYNSGYCLCYKDGDPLLTRYLG